MSWSGQSPKPNTDCSKEPEVSSAGSQQSGNTDQRILGHEIQWLITIVN